MPADGAKTIRQERLVKALRENLKRRKAQARERDKASDTSVDEACHSPERAPARRAD